MTMLEDRSEIAFPKKVAPIFTPAPVKVIYGGRGKGASWSFARALLTLGMHKGLFIVCAREVQKSIKDSVHKLLADQIEKMGYDKFYDVLDVEIRHKTNGTTFAFVGLNNVDSLKSMESIDILWVTEAKRVPKSKWTVLFPTVRRDPPYGPFGQGSEIWIDFNPDLASDDTYKMFVVDPPEDAIVIYMTYEDNLWFPEILRKQMEQMRVKDYEEYLTTWLGRTRKTLSGAIFAKELGEIIEKGQITPHVKHVRGQGVTLVFDLGDSDMTAMWVFQQIGYEHNAVFYHEESGKPIEYFIKMAQQRGYIIKRVVLPHDARQSHQSARLLVNNTIEKQAKALLPTPGIVKTLPNVSEVTMISAARSLIPRMNMNEIDCSQGILCLQHYQFGVDQHTKQRTKQPLHNWASHGSKSLCYYAVQMVEGHRLEQEAATGMVDTDLAADGRVSTFGQTRSQSWLGR